jgi:hypothetical protein
VGTEKGRQRGNDTTTTAIRQDTQSPIVDTSEGKASILARHFFSPSAQADLSDIGGDMQTGSPLRIEQEVTIQEVTIQEVTIQEVTIQEVTIQEVTIQEALEDLGRLPSRKAHGPDGIPNEALKACREEIAPTIAELANVSFEVGHFPSTFRRTTTVVLKKEGKKDYSLPGSYRPIALENTLIKVVEEFVTTQITCALEEHDLLPTCEARSIDTYGSLTTHVNGPFGLAERTRLHRLNAQPRPIRSIRQCLA